MKAELTRAERVLREKASGHRGTRLDKLPGGCLKTCMNGKQRHGSLLADTYRWLQGSILPEIQIFVKKYSGKLKLVILAKHIPRWAYVISYI